MDKKQWLVRTALPPKVGDLLEREKHLAKEKHLAMDKNTTEHARREG